MTVRRIVFDTMYVRNVSEHDLATLRNRGFLLSISIATLQEVWARSVLDNNRGLLFTRSKKLDKYLDQELPLTPIGAELKRVVRLAHRPSVARRRAASVHADTLRALWRAVVEEHVPEDQWLGTGQAAQQAMNDDEWPAHVNDVIGAHPELRTMSEREAAQSLRGLLANDSVLRRLEKRCNAHGSVFALRIIKAAKSKKEEFRRLNTNDSQDTQLLMQVALPAFVATDDRRLLQDVDASGTYQAPWVRTLKDLLTGELPACLPWGPDAKKVARSFRRLE